MFLSKDQNLVHLLKHLEIEASKANIYEKHMKIKMLFLYKSYVYNLLTTNVHLDVIIALKVRTFQILILCYYCGLPATLL